MSDDGVVSRGVGKVSPREIHTYSFQTKMCSRCNMEKPVSDFDIDRSKKSGYKSQCKMCQSITRKLRKNNNTLPITRKSIATPRETSRSLANVISELTGSTPDEVTKNALLVYLRNVLNEYDNVK